MTDVHTPLFCLVQLLKANSYIPGSLHHHLMFQYYYIGNLITTSLIMKRRPEQPSIMQNRRRKKGKQFLHKIIERRRKEEALAGKRHRQHLERRVKAILSLKQNIDSSQGTMQAQQMLRNEENKRLKEEGPFFETRLITYKLLFLS